MRIRGRFRWKLVLLALILIMPKADAQESATIQALATVIPSLTVTGTNNLDFEEVTPGADKYVNKTTAGLAGEWTIAGPLSAEIDIDFTLPDSIRNPGIAAMDIGFSDTDASYEDGSGGGQVAPAGVLNPNITNTNNLSASGTFTIWIGGTVYPDGTQTGGDYSGDVTLTVTLTGN
ncbi:MAG: hypothetical protein GY855_12165 [candidate division Zixibacteria bacterium]|nr:hypothetical protein [candidate division Zixibacteria bacterium]